MELKQIKKRGNGVIIVLTGFANLNDWFAIQKDEKTGTITLTPVKAVES